MIDVLIDPFALVNLEIIKMEGGEVKCIASFCNAKNVGYEAYIYHNDNGVTRCPIKFKSTAFEFVEKMESEVAKGDVIAAIKSFASKADGKYSGLLGCAKLGEWRATRKIGLLNVLIQYVGGRNALAVYYPPNCELGDLDEVTISLGINDCGAKCPACITHSLQTDAEVASWAVERTVSFVKEHPQVGIKESDLRSADVSLNRNFVYPRWYFVETTLK